jgi:hypothetical protein
MFFFGHRFGSLPWHNCQLEVLPMSLEDLLPMSSDHTGCIQESREFPQEFPYGNNTH